MASVSQRLQDFVTSNGGNVAHTGVPSKKVPSSRLQEFIAGNQSTGAQDHLTQPSAAPAAVKLTAPSNDLKASLAAIDNFKPDDQIKTIQKASQAGLIDKATAHSAIAKVSSGIPIPKQSESLAYKVANAVHGVAAGITDVTGGVIGTGLQTVENLNNANAAVHTATSDFAGGKGFDFTNQYKKIQKERGNPLQTAADWYDKHAGTNIGQSVKSATTSPIPAAIATGAAVLTGGESSVAKQAAEAGLTAVYGSQYVKNLPKAIGAIAKEPDMGKKFQLATETVLGGVLLAKGAFDTIKGTSLPATEKTVSISKTIPNEQARAFFNEPNPNLDPATSSLLTKALSDNKSQFVQELKAGGGVSVQDVATVPTVYGKLVDIIKTKMGKGEPLTPAETAVVHDVATDPVKYVPTGPKELAAPNETPVAPPAVPTETAPAIAPQAQAPAPVAQAAPPVVMPPPVGHQPMPVAPKAAPAPKVAEPKPDTSVADVKKIDDKVALIKAKQQDTGKVTNVDKVKLQQLEEQKQVVSGEGTTATAQLRYPQAKELPETLKGQLPTSYKNGEMTTKGTSDLTPTEQSRIQKTDTLFGKTQIKEMIKLVPGLKANPVMTIEDHEGHPALHYKDESHDVHVKLSAVGISDERMAASGLKAGDTIDLSKAMEEKGKLPTIQKGKAMFSSGSGSSSATATRPAAAPAAKVEPKPANNTPPVHPDTVGGKVNEFIGSIGKTSVSKGASSNLGDDLHALVGEQTADMLVGTKLLKSIVKLKVSPKDWEAVYHYAEDKSSPVTPQQQALYNQAVKPLQDGINEMRKDMGLEPLGNEDFIHRIAIGRGSSLERFLQEETKGIRLGNALRKTSDSMKSRTMMKLVDDSGNTKIVSISTPKDVTGKALGERTVVEWKNGEKVGSLGALKRKLPAKAKEYVDPVLTAALEKIAVGLGIEHTRTNVPLKRGDRPAGVHYEGTNVVKTRVGSSPDVLLHEIGHFVDTKYDLQKQFIKDNLETDTKVERAEKVLIHQELRDLADKRVGEVSSKSFGKYVRKGEEKIAVMFQAYLHAPDIFQAIAPTTYDKFDAFLKSHADTAPITHYMKSLQMATNEVGQTRLQGEFIDKNDHKWQIKNATTKEIEANTKVRYYKQPLVSTVLDYIETRQALRATKYLDTLKRDPGFLYKNEDGVESGIAIKSDAPRIPKDWKTTQALQFKGYHFEPRTAEAMDDFAKLSKSGDVLGAVTGLNQFLRTSIFFNPLMHIPNEFWHWATRRGISGLANPMRLARGVVTTVQAFQHVIAKDDLYQTYLREGGSIMGFDRDQLSTQIDKIMTEAVKDKNFVATMAHLAGYANPAAWLKAWYKISPMITWGSHDIFNMQSYLEEMKAHPGLSMDEAIHKVGAHLPDYRVPERVMGSRKLKTIGSDPNVLMFTKYHYGIFKSYANLVRETAGLSPRGVEQGEGFSGHAKQTAEGIDKLLMLGIIAFIIYPQLDKLAKKIFNNPEAKFRRPGPLTIPAAIVDTLEGRKTPGQLATTVLPVPPGTKGAYQLVRNRDDINRQIWNPGEIFTNPLQAAKDLGAFASGTVAPLNQAKQVSTGKMSLSGLAGSLIGVSQGKSDTAKLVSKLLGNQLNQGVQSKAQQRISAQKNAARDQIAAGKGDALAKALVDQGVIKADKLKAFEDTAKWTPTQRAFDSLNMSNKLAVFQKTSPKNWSDLGDLSTIKAEAQKTSASKTATAANRSAAADLVNTINQGFAVSNGKTTQESLLQTIGAYASAFGTSPLTAFNRIFTGQRILRTSHGAIIVQRLPLSASQGIKAQQGGKNAQMKLDHTVPLELGGSNDISNLRLVTTDTWASYTPIEDYLGGELRSGKINAKTATRLIKGFKNGTISADEVRRH